MHPCFNNPFTAQIAEMVDGREGLKTTYAVKVFGYLTPATAHGTAMNGQPRPDLYFHRSLEMLLGAGLRAGFVLDGLEVARLPARPSGS